MSTKNKRLDRLTGGMMLLSALIDLWVFRLARKEERRHAREALWHGAIMPTDQWLSLPRDLQDWIRREFCCRGPDSKEYRDAVAVAHAYVKGQVIIHPRGHG